MGSISRTNFRVGSLILIPFITLFITFKSYGQAQYTDSVYRPDVIKSVELYNAKKEATFPIINLGSGEKLQLGFDDLRGGSNSFYYTIEHCDADWNSSNLSSTEYLSGYNEDRIMDYTYSSATVQKYTHYRLQLPNQNMSPKLSGNYILKVYEDDDPTKIIFTRRFYVLRTKVSLIGNIIASNDNSLRQTNQKINFEVNYGSLYVQNPSRDIRVLVMQNMRYETSRFTTSPNNIRGSQLIYNDMSTNDYPGRNEFRHFDTRSLKINSDHILRIYREDTVNRVLMLSDPVRDDRNYTLIYDNDGRYYILNQDGSDPTYDADYARMYFNLATDKTPRDGSAYIVGKFNDYKLDNYSKLSYDADKKVFYRNLFLKQGVCDYEYIWVDKSNNTPDDTVFEGNYFETENNYQILVYYHPASARWEELVGFQVINSVKK